MSSRSFSVSADYVIERFKMAHREQPDTLVRVFSLGSPNDIGEFFVRRIMPHFVRHIWNQQPGVCACLNARSVLRDLAPEPTQTFFNRLAQLQDLVKTAMHVERPSSAMGGGASSTKAVKAAWTKPNALFDASTNTLYTTSAASPKKFVLTNGGVPRSIDRAVYNAHLNKTHTSITIKVGRRFHTMLVGLQSLKQVGGESTDGETEPVRWGQPSSGPAVIGVQPLPLDMGMGGPDMGSVDCNCDLGGC
jgi:hypothetical protein